MARTLSKQLSAHIGSGSVAGGVEGGFSDAGREEARLCYLAIAERVAVKLLSGEHLVKGSAG